MNLAESIDVNQLLRDDSEFGPDEALQIQEALCSAQSVDVRHQLAALADEVAESGTVRASQLVRLGVGYFYLGRQTEAEKHLSRVSDNPVATFYLALVYTSQDRHEEAEQKFIEAVNLGYDKIECTLRRAGAVRALGRLEEAEQVLRSVSSEGVVRAEYSYQMGCIWADRGDTATAVEYFERAVDMDQHHSRALFRLAAENALHGNDDEAIRLYEQSLSKPPYFQGALINLGLLYEDAENYSAAAYCFRRVLEHNPTHARARLYLRDIEATSEMYYDEETARQEARMEQLLSQPITDFELSVRSRNCLESMNIFTLGDLTEISEQELLAGKNFGETSLHEIREMLGAHGLRIGQNLHKAKAREMVFDTTLSPEEQTLLSNPVAELNLSVRARKCMTRLGITTIGQLVQRTADELLSSRNFGVTSLNEVRSKLSEISLKLRND